ncbi:sulfite dehydrogenase [uncultured Sphingomonas sp.]|uniref:sulfite dehydrogenase n=1 Tax=uncultured Sphingomonas sp. TaxID=158754 RepID=UPI00262CE9E0|nr:sulfite dehydrogenase [uncultured Sphingomonas sp.]
MAREELGGERAAGGGLLHRRALLRWSAVSAAGLSAERVMAQEGLPASMLEPGAPLSPRGAPGPAGEAIRRIVPDLAFPGTGSSRTPVHLLEGTITPNDLHFERHHNGIPTIDPGTFQLLLHGLVRRPLVFRYEDLLRYPRESRLLFIECSGNSGALSASQPVQASAGQLHGLVSCAEWTGVRLSTLLDEAGLLPGVRWIEAEGADAAAMTRSIPLSVGLDDAMIALFQNGEPLRPAQGYPMRLLLPGIEGNASVKWLRRLKVRAQPVFSREETAKYTDLRRDGKAEMFSLRMGVKSVIVSPSFGLDLGAKGYREISGLAWSGRGRIRSVEVSADGGASWAEAALGDVQPKALTRFRMPWHWDGGPAVLLSRATDDTGAVQPTRETWLAKQGHGQGYHSNAMQSWAVDTAGRVTHVYA